MIITITTAKKKNNNNLNSNNNNFGNIKLKKPVQSRVRSNTHATVGSDDQSKIISK